MNFEKTCSSAELSEALLITKRRVRGLAQEGIIKKTARGEYNFYQSIKGYIQYLLDQTFDSKDNPVDRRSLRHTQEVERAKLLKHKAEIARMQSEEIALSLVNKKDADKEKVLMCSYIRTQLLAIPDRIAPHIAPTNDHDAVFHLLEDAFIKTLTDVADGMESGEFIDGRFKLPWGSGSECEHWEWVD